MSDMNRKKVLWKARNTALQILALRHPEELVQIKNQSLAQWGHAPIDPAMVQRTSSIYDPSTPDGADQPQEEAAP